MSIRDERAAAITRRYRDLSDNFTRALPGLLDELENIDEAHPVPVADLGSADHMTPGKPEFDTRTAEIREQGFGHEADARDKLAAETRAAPAKPATRRRTTR